MRHQRILLSLLAAICLTAACATAPPQTATTAPSAASAAPKMTKTEIENALFQIEKDGAVSMVKDDVSFIERTMADDWMWTMPNGMMMNKAELIKEVKAGNYKFTEATMTDLHASIYDNTAIVRGKQTVKGKYQNQDISGAESFTDTFVNINGQWRCVATHNSAAMKK